MIKAGRRRGGEREAWGHNTDPTPRRCSTWRRRARPDRPQGDREDSTSRSTGTRSRRRRAIRRSRSTTGTRTSPRARTTSTWILNGEHIVNVGNNNVSNTVYPGVQPHDRRDEGDARSARPETPSGLKLDALFHAERRRLGWPFMNSAVARSVSLAIARPRLQLRATSSSCRRCGSRSEMDRRGRRTPQRAAAAPGWPWRGCGVTRLRGGRRSSSRRSSSPASHSRRCGCTWRAATAPTTRTSRGT